MNEKLAIHSPDGIHGWGIEFQSDNNELIEKFVKICQENLDKGLGWFHQFGLLLDGNFSNYQYFEFLLVRTSDEKSIDLMITECFKIAKLMEMDLQL